MLKLSPLRKNLNGDDKSEAIGEIFISNMSCKKRLNLFAEWIPTSRLSTFLFKNFLC